MYLRHFWRISYSKMQEKERHCSPSADRISVDTRWWLIVNIITVDHYNNYNLSLTHSQKKKIEIASLPYLTEAPPSAMSLVTSPTPLHNRWALERTTKSTTTCASPPCPSATAVHRLHQIHAHGAGCRPPLADTKPRRQPIYLNCRTIHRRRRKQFAMCVPRRNCRSTTQQGGPIWGRRKKFRQGSMRKKKRGRGKPRHRMKCEEEEERGKKKALDLKLWRTSHNWSERRLLQIVMD